MTAPVTVRRVDRMTARALGAGPAGSVVLRPDGVAVQPSRQVGGRLASARRVQVPC